MCTNIKTSIDSLLAELCKQLSYSNNQGLQEQVCHPHRISASLESDLAQQACSTESDRNPQIDSGHAKRGRKASLVGRGDFETGQKLCDQESTAVKKEVNLNHSSVDQQLENEHLQFQPVDDQYNNISQKNQQNRPLIKENDLVKYDIDSNQIDHTIEKERNKKLLDFDKKILDFDKKFENYDIDIIKNFKGGNKDKIRNKKKDYQESNKDKIIEQVKAYREINKDKLRKQTKDYQESNKDKFKEYQKSNKDKMQEQVKAYRKANKDKLRKQTKDYQESNKDKISNYHKNYRESNKDKIRQREKENRGKKISKN